MNLENPRESAPDYNKTVEGILNPKNAVQKIQDFFTNHGFLIVQNEPESVTLASHGSMFISTRNPMQMVSRVHATAQENSVTLQADFGGVKKIGVLLVIFIVAMALFFLVLFGALFGMTGKMPWINIIGLSLLPLSPWPIIIPLMMVYMKRKITELLDILMENAKQTV